MGVPGATSNEQLAAQAQGGNKRARDLLVTRNMGLLHSRARRWLRYARIATQEDLVADGSLGILAAIDHFDPTRGASFATYAIRWIDRHMRRAANDDKNVLSGLKGDRHLNAAKEVRAAMESGLSRPEAEAAAAKKLGASAEVVAAQSRMGTVGSLDAPIGDGEDSTSLLGGLADETEERADDRLAVEQRRHAVRECVRNMDLSAKERAIVERRLIDEATLEDVGHHFGVSRERIRQIESALLPRLRHALKRHIDGPKCVHREVSASNIAAERQRIRRFAAKRGFPVQWAEAVHRLKFPEDRDGL